MFLNLDLPIFSKSTKIDENRRKSTKIRENQWKSTKINENPRKSAKIRENLRKSVKISENLRKSTKIRDIYEIYRIYIGKIIKISTILILTHFGICLLLAALKTGWKSFLEAIRFILAKYGPVASHGDPNREGFRRF